jgi:transposase
MVYVGVDLHRRVSQVSAMDEKGEVLLTRRIRTEPLEFLRVFGELGPEPMSVAFEATFGWGWFAELLKDAGIAAHMAHPRDTKAIANARVKNDAVDAKTLAHLLRAELLPEAWMAPLEVREARRLVRMRGALVRIRSRLKNQVHAVLADQGVLFPMSDIFGALGREELARLQLPPLMQHRLDGHLRLIADIANEVNIADREIRDLFKNDSRRKRLQAIPGIGLLTAATVLAEVGDFARFPSADHLCSWAGLTPKERSSADNVRRGRITKQGSRWLRWALVEAAVTAERNPDLRALSTRIAARGGRNGKSIARVAVARRLLTLCFYAVRDAHGCRAFPVAS